MKELTSSAVVVLEASLLIAEVVFAMDQVFQMVMPGDNVEITVELIYPVALNLGLRFAIREGGRTVGSGQITEIID